MRCSLIDALVWAYPDSEVPAAPCLRLEAHVARGGTAAAVILMVPPIITFILAQSRVIETMAHSGIK